MKKEISWRKMSGLNSNNISNIKNESIRNNSNENNNNSSINNNKNNINDINNNITNNNNSKKNKKNEPEFIYKIHADNAHEFIMKSNLRLISNFDIFLIFIFTFLLSIFVINKIKFILNYI